MSSGKRAPNRLALETSPYLLQHAHNPVDWYAWGEEALARAAREQRPILLSIGYSACHWCHVMEHESFEDHAVAARMNADFVCIKVDREERPDLDDIYMAATLSMTGQGGWPMTVFLLPDQRPFFAGTYFPKETRYGRPGFGDLVTRIAEVWREDRAGVVAQADKLTQAMQHRLSGSAPGEVVHDATLRAVAQLAEDYDAEFGGFGGAPKFPPCPALRLLLRASARDGAADALRMARGTLDGMARGGMRDHLGGGFARYSTDERWHVPHFEKMLYDNAQLAQVYSEAYALTGSASYRTVVTETLDYLLREMVSDEGAFYSATDADSEGEEGKYFTFTRAALRGLDPQDERVFCAYYDVRDEGNWEGTNVLWTPRSEADVAHALGLEVTALRDSLLRAKETVRVLRSARVAPARDDKLLASWNGLAISAFASAYGVLGTAAYRTAAERALRHVQALLRRPDGGLYRTARAGHAHLDAYLEDYAFLGSAALDLYEVTGDAAHARYARQLCARLIADFFDHESGTFYQTAIGHEPLLARPRDGHDGALPNAAAIAAQLCARIGIATEDAALLRIAERACSAFGAAASRTPRAFCSMIGAAEFVRDPSVTVALVGASDDPRTEALRSALTASYGTARVIVYGDGLDDRGEPLLRDRPCPGGRPAAYVCVRETCSLPITEPAELVRALTAGAAHHAPG